MTDTERLNLIEYYKWSVSFTVDGYVLIVRLACNVNVIAADIRTAIDLALKAQVKWSMS